jgi:tetratricopeptide (TPR) repeat protein
VTAAELLEQGTALRAEGRFAEAIRLLDQSARLDPANPDVWLERGILFDLGGSLDNARASYAEAIRLGGGVPPLAGFASVSARKGDYARAQQAAEHALSLSPGEPVSTMVLSRCDIERSDYASAERRLRPLVDRADLSDQDRMIASGLMGDVLDKLGRTAEAFVEYTRAKARFAQIHSIACDSQPPVSGVFEKLADAFTSIPAARWVGEADRSAGAAPNHIFLIGHPRSGTTLVENILASAPGVAALEERQTLRDADAAYFVEPHKLVDLVDVDEDGLAALREAYWQRVRAAGIPAGVATFVDMDPMKGTRLPMIARLFPQARIVIMRRDPRDVVLSCFRTSFVPTASSCQFATLEGAARHYDTLMRLQQECLATLPLASHEVFYEQLVADFDGTTKTLCDFTGLVWSDDLRRFDRTAEARGVTTASQTQVRRGLYDGRAQWRRYEAELAPIMPILQPWIEKLGYAGTP